MKRMEVLASSFRRSWAVLQAVRLVGLVALLQACGDGSEASDGAARGGAASGGAAGGGATGGGAAGSSGHAGSSGGEAGSQAGTAGSSGGGNSAIDCSAAFGEATSVLNMPAGQEIVSPTLSPNGLELFYAGNRTEPVGGFRRSTRATKADSFDEGEPVPELDALCQSGDLRSLDLSADGLRAYVTCISPEVLPFTGPLRVAERADANSPFVADPMDYGSVGDSPSISFDELDLYTSNDYNPGTGSGRHYSRMGTDAAFGEPGEITGLESEFLTAPEPAPDGLGLFMGRNGSLSLATRSEAGASFDSPTDLIAASDRFRYGSPEVSSDCRTLYFVSLDSAGEEVVYSLQTMTR